MTRISVTGTAEERRAPEEAVANVRVGFDGTDREQVLADALATHEHVGRDAATFVASGAARRWVAQSVFVEPYQRFLPDTDRTETRYRTGTQVSVTFADVDALSRWITEIGGVAGVTLDGITWQLTDTTRDTLLERARARAVEDAAARASVYARAAGLRAEPRLVLLAEPGLRPAPGSPIAMDQPRFARAASAAAPVTLELDDVVVAAEITADFEVADD